MPAVQITPADLAPFATIEQAKAEAMIADALAWAALDAPCILSETFEYADAAKAIIRKAILRWNDSGSGAFSQRQQTTGPFAVGESIDTRVNRDSMFTDGEIASLKRLCTGETSGAFQIDTAPSCAVVHAEACSINFGATYCSCGADIAGYPLWELDP